MFDRWCAGPVCAETLVQEVLVRFPGTLPVFWRYGLPCPRCLASSYENVSQVSIMLRVDLARLLADLNEAAAAPPIAERLPYGRLPERN